MVFLLWSLTLAMFFHGTASALIVNNKILLSSLCIYFGGKKLINQQIYLKLAFIKIQICFIYKLHVLARY